jgi:hypothetical protein
LDLPLVLSLIELFSLDVSLLFVSTGFLSTCLPYVPVSVP